MASPSIYVDGAQFRQIIMQAPSSRQFIEFKKSKRRDTGAGQNSGVACGISLTVVSSELVDVVALDIPGSICEC